MEYESEKLAREEGDPRGYKYPWMPLSRNFFFFSYESYPFIFEQLRGKRVRKVGRWRMVNAKKRNEFRGEK